MNLLKAYENSTAGILKMDRNAHFSIGFSYVLNIRSAFGVPAICSQYGVSMPFVIFYSFFNIAAMSVKHINKQFLLLSSHFFDVSLVRRQLRIHTA